MFTGAVERGRHPLWNGFRNLCTVFTVLFGLLFGSTQIPSLNRSVCASDFSADHQRWSALLCEPDRLAITDEQATRFIDTFSGSLFGSQRGMGAWVVLSGPTSTEVPTSFTATWDPVVFARRVGDVENGGGVNIFKATIQRYRYPPEWLAKPKRFYEAPRLSVDQVDLTFELSLTDRRVIRSSAPTSTHRKPLGMLKQAVMTAAVPTDFYGDLDVDTDNTPDFHPIGRGSKVRGVCQERSGNEPEWWTMTYLGWVKNQDYALEDAETAGLGLCP